MATYNIENNVDLKLSFGSDSSPSIQLAIVEHFKNYRGSLSVLLGEPLRIQTTCNGVETMGRTTRLFCFDVLYVSKGISYRMDASFHRDFVLAHRNVHGDQVIA